MRRKWWMLIPPVLAAGIWFFCCESEEDKVTAKIRELAELISKPAGEAPAAGMMRLAGTNRIFAPQVEIDLRRERFHGGISAGEIPARIAAFRKQMIKAEAGVADIEFTLLTGEQAEVSFSGSLEGIVSGGGRIAEVREVEAALVKTPEGWRISRLVLRPVLER